MKRKDAIDYSRKFKSLTNQIYKLDIEIRERLLFLVDKYPDAVIGNVNDSDGNIIELKARNTISKTYVDRLSIEVCIKYLELIKKWIDEQCPHTQLEIKFQDEKENKEVG